MTTRISAAKTTKPKLTPKPVCSNAPTKVKAAKLSPTKLVEPISKQDNLIALLRRPQGADMETMANATGWQNHSVRGFLSGTLKKKLGHAVISEKLDGKSRVYRIGGAA